MSETQVMVVHHSAGISVGCSTCRTIMGQGEYMIGITVDNSHYVVGEDPQKECCGRKKNFPRLFQNLVEAEHGLQAVHATLEKDGISGLKLVQPSGFTEGNVQ